VLYNRTVEGNILKEIGYDRSDTYVKEIYPDMILWY